MRGRGSLLVVAALLGCESATNLDDSASDSGETTPIFDPPDPECGNGYLEPGEDCDDANVLDGDGCDSLCRLPCGLAFETQLTVSVPDIVPVVVDLVIAGNGDMIVAATNGTTTSEFTDDLWLGRWNAAGELQWSDFFDLGGAEHAAGVVVDDQGRMFLAGTIDAPDGGTDAWLGAFEADGSEAWTQTYSGVLVGSKDGANGLAIAADGSPIVSGFQRVADQDGDTWVARVDPADGAVVWELFWSGEIAANGFSLDVGGPITVGPDGTIWTLAVEYVDFETYDVHLLEIADDGSAVVSNLAPQAGGVAHSHVGSGVTVAPDGTVYFGITRLGPASTFWVHALDPDGELTWVRELPSFLDVGEDWALRDLAISPVVSPEDGLLFVAGDLVRDEIEDNWVEAFLHRLDAAGVTTCATRYTALGSGALAPSLVVGAVAGDADGNLVAAGRITDVENQQSVWIGSFRGP